MMAVAPLHADADILIVDDNDANVALLEALLEDQGYTRIQGLTDPRLVEARVAHQCPDLILLDVRMPHLNGFEVMQILRARLGDQDPAIIVLTAQTDDDTRYRALELGARDFLTKPFDHLEVLQRIGNTLQLQRLMQGRKARADLLEALVTERTQELAARSRQDPQTGLPNRRALLELLRGRVEQQQDTTVCFIALHGMDDVARLHGFITADSLASAIARRLMQCPGLDRSMLGVWNSTEWVLIGPEGHGNANAQTMAQHILTCFGQPFTIEHMSLHVNARVGVSTLLDDRHAEQLIRMAALALPAKEGQWQSHNHDLEQALLRRNGLREALRNAARGNELHLVYQPKIDLPSGQVVGAEALLRWESPVYALVSPGEFIPLAEASGEILTIGAWVVQEALRELTHWRAQGAVDSAFKVAINVAASQLMQTGFAQWLIDTVDRSAVTPAQLELEVTESGLMQDITLATQQLTTLAQAGFSIAIDDFGTGYSSLAYLKSLPVSVLKIDREFIRELHTSAQDQRLTGTVIDMARHFGFKTVAEGVERQEQVDWLKRMGCDLVQGFMFAPPLKAPALLKMVAMGPLL